MDDVGGEGVRRARHPPQPHLPGPTDTPMMSDFERARDHARHGGDWDAMAQGLGRPPTPAEQGWPLIFLNSDAAPYISGENVNTDGGTMSGIMTGTITVEMPEM
ncbi:MAG: SDR family oxidoreductase [Acidimicrobiia bacterium]